MKKSFMTNLVLLLFACFGWVGPAQSSLSTLPAQKQDDALKVLQKTSETYRNMTSSYFEGTLVLEFSSKQGDLKIDMPLVIAEVKPNKVKYELKDPKYGGTRVSDGKTLWVYQSRSKQYTKQPVDTVKAASSFKGSAEYEHISERVKSAKILRDESLTVNGENVNCYVIELVTEPLKPNPDIVSAPRLLWIDKINNIILKDVSRAKLNATKGEEGQVNNTIIKTLSSAKVNQPIPDSMFVFIPPEGAVEVEKTK